MLRPRCPSTIACASLRHERRDGDHEHQVEEQLERGRRPVRLVVAPRALASARARRARVLVESVIAELLGDRLHARLELGEARRQRRQAEADAARATEVRDDAALPEARHDPLEVGVVERDVASAARGVAGRRELDAREQRVGEGDRLLGQGDRLGSHGIQARLFERGERRLEADHADDRRRAAQHPPDAVGRLVALAHLERGDRPEPALDRLPVLVLEGGRDVGERGRSRPAVEVLVAAADREVDAPGVQLERPDARRRGRGPRARARRRRARSR